MPELIKSVRGLSPVSVYLSLAVVPLIYLLCLYMAPLISSMPSPGAPPQCPNHEYSVEIVSQNPLMIYINNFLSEEEIKWLLNKG